MPGNTAVTNDAPAAVSGTTATGRLDFLALLLNDRRQLHEWLRHREPAIRQPFTRATLLMAGLQTVSDTRPDVLLDDIQCDTRNAGELEDLDPDRLERCVAFLSWVLTLSLETPADHKLRRATIGSASAMYADMRGDLNACRDAIDGPTSADDPVTPRELIAIGQVGAAFRIARAKLPGRVGERASEWQKHRAASGVHQDSHVGPRILGALLSYSNHPGENRLGVSRAVALLQHIGGCEPCARAYEDHARLVKLDEAQLLKVDTSLTTAADMGQIVLPPGA